MRITRSVLQTGLLMAILVAVLGEFVVPGATRMAKTYRAEAMEEKLIVGGTNDLWARDGARYVNVKSILPDHQLRYIRLYEIDEQHKLKSIVYAESARYEGEEWILNNIKRSDISEAGVSTSTEKQMILQRLILLELFTVLELESKDMSARELFTYIEYLVDNNIDSDEYRLELWIKILMPFTCLAMLLIAMPIVFATTPRSGGTGQRIVLAILIGIVYFVINRSMNHLGLALDIAPLLSASLPLMMITVVSVYFLQRIN
jgi:lipopolysaccharide export system permease protein